MNPISVVIITYNRPEDTLQLLRNIAAQQSAKDMLANVVVWNNASTEDYSSVEDFIAQSALPFEYVHSTGNWGVAEGRNRALALAKGEIIVTIDDDAYFAQDNALLQIAALFETDFARQNNVGVFCFKVFYESTGALQANAFPHKKFERYREKSQFLTSYFIGCGHAILRKVYDAAGPYPADFFYGMEEYDLGYRILDAGFRIAYDERVHIIHKESPVGRTPHAEKMQMLWVNKSKVAYRYLPMRYFWSTAFMWGLQFLKKTNYNFPLFFAGIKKVAAVPRLEKRKPVSASTLSYLHSVEARLAY